jgi:hypothetical protein
VKAQQKKVRFLVRDEEDISFAALTLNGIFINYKMLLQDLDSIEIFARSGFSEANLSKISPTEDVQKVEMAETDRSASSDG